MSRGPREVILRPDVRRGVIESEGARGTFCGIAYVVLLFYRLKDNFRSSLNLMVYFETFETFPLVYCGVCGV